jgi:TRAP-type C4-dicarboxylate transport system substrate-binding protein
MRAPHLVPLMTAFALALVGCGGDNDAQETEPASSTPEAVEQETDAASVADTQPAVVLRVGTNDPSDQPYMAAVMAEFTRQATAVSGGSVQITPVFRAAGDPPPDDWDQAVARRVMSGELEMGLIPSAAWDSEGVTSLTPLNAPFLIDSNELVASVVDSELAGTLMSGLDGVGITGLALVPESLRHVFGYGDPLLAPSDFAGGLIRSPRSETVYELFHALGATVDDLRGSSYDEAVVAGEVRGSESSFARAATLPGANLVATGNLPLFPKVNVLVVNTAAFDELSTQQQEALRQAAAATRAYAIDAMPDPLVSAQDFCAAGGSVVLASATDASALMEAAQPVYEHLEADPVARGLIASFREMKVGVPHGTAVESCGTSHTSPSTDAAPAGNVIPLGSYTRTITAADGEALGLDPAVVAEMLGPSGQIETTLEIGDGRWTLHVASDDFTGIGDFGAYTYDDQGRWRTVSESGGCHGCVGLMQWTMEDGVLTLNFAPDVAQGQGDRGPTPDERLMVVGRYNQQP